MRRTVTKLFILVAVANILVGGFALLTYRYTVVPLLIWLGSLARPQLEMLLSFIAKCEIALGLAFLIAAALVGRSFLQK